MYLVSGLVCWRWGRGLRNSGVLGGHSQLSSSATAYFLRAEATRIACPPVLLRPCPPCLHTDTLFGADLTIMEEGTELLHRLKQHLQQVGS